MARAPRTPRSNGQGGEVNLAALSFAKFASSTILAWNTKTAAITIPRTDHLTSHNHAVVWIDHREARVFHFDRESVDRLALHPDNPPKHLHHKANSIGSGKASEDQDYFHSVAAALADGQSILITGPANAKAELVKHIHRHEPKLIERIAVIETVDHPTDKELVAHARANFKADNQILPRII